MVAYTELVETSALQGTCEVLNMSMDIIPSTILMDIQLLLANILKNN